MSDGKQCIRDGAGFCRLALAGHAACFQGRDRERCTVPNVEAAREALEALALRQLKKSPFFAEGRP